MKDKYLRVTMPDGTKWDVPVMVIAENRAKYYAKADDEFGGSFKRSLNEDTLPLFKEDDYEIKDWAAGNMDWDDVSHAAVKVTGTPEPDYQEGWVNGEKEVIQK